MTLDTAKPRQRSGGRAPRAERKGTGAPDSTNVPAQRSEERFRTLVETIPAAVFLYDEQTLYVNSAAERITGYSRDELLGIGDFWQLVHPDSRPRLMEVYTAHERGETIPTEYEVQIVTKSGESRWVLFVFDWVGAGPERGALLGTAIDITRRKTAEASARRIGDQLRAMFDAFPDLLLRLDAQATILEYLASPGRPLYRQPEEFLGRRVSEVMPPDVALLMEEAIGRVRTFAEPVSIEYSLPFRAGKRYLETRLMPFAEDEVLALVRDVTGRKAAEEALRASEIRYKALYMDNPTMYFTLAPNGMVLSVNEFGARQLGYSAQELEGKPVFHVFHPADRRTAREQLTECLANPGKVATWQIRKLRKDGSVMWVDERARVANDSDGNVIVLIVCEDITEQHEMEADLQASRARLSAFAHAVPDVAFILDEDGTYLEVLGLPQRADLLARQPAELLGRRLHDVLPKKSADAFLGVVRRTILTQESQALEYELNTPAGLRWFEGRSAPLPLPGRKRMVVWVAHDITVRKQAEQALIDTREELESKVEAVAGRAAKYGLTFREMIVLQLLISGKSDREIGAMLGISPLTANKHVGNLMRKMKVRSRTSASVLAVREGLAT